MAFVCISIMGAQPEIAHCSKPPPTLSVCVYANPKVATRDPLTLIAIYEAFFVSGDGEQEMAKFGVHTCIQTPSFIYGLTYEEIIFSDAGFP